MKRASFFVVLVLAASCFGGSDALATLAETITPKIVSGECAAGGTIFENRTSNSMSFDLFILNNTGATCPVAASWTDATGKSQSITVSNPPSPTSSLPSPVVATSLPPNGAISWSSQGNGNVNFNWYLSQPASVANNGSALSCQLSGTLYENLSPAPVNLHLAVSAQSYSVSLRWVDAGGASQELDLAGGLNGNGLPEYQNSEGVATSLPPGGAITFATGTGKYCSGSSWEFERAVGDQ
jgi:hypothetical protein